MGNQILYKWEENNHGLGTIKNIRTQPLMGVHVITDSDAEHKCGTCKTVLSSPRAKKTCFGIHEEVCSKYHKTLFYLGMAHKCEACRKSNQLHEKRHREIAELIQKILEEDAITDVSSPSASRKRKTRTSDAIDRLKITGDLNDMADIEEDSWADSSTLNDDDSQPSRSTLALDTKEITPSKKAQKAERKIARHQSRFKGIAFEEINKVNDVLHPPRERNPLGDRTNEHGTSSGGLPNDATIAANITFNTRTFRFASLRPEIHKKKILKANGDPNRTPNSKAPTIPTSNPQDSLIVTTILLRLGVPTAPLHLHKDRKAQIARLRNQIVNDLECVDNEDRETMMRMAGYWRYVNRKTYNAMVRNNQLWDWETGAKLDEIEENDGDDGDGISEGDTEVASPPAVAEDYGGDYELGDDVKKLQLLGRGTEFGDIEFDKDEDANVTQALPTTVKGPFFATIQDTRHAPDHSTNTPFHSEHANDTPTPIFTTVDDTPTPTQAAFSGIKDTRYPTHPTSFAFSSPTKQASTATITHPALTLTVPNSIKPNTTTTLRGCAVTGAEQDDESEEFPLLPPRADPNNRFSLLATSPRPRAKGQTIKIVRPRTLALKIPKAEEGEGKEGESWATVFKGKGGK